MTKAARAAAQAKMKRDTVNKAEAAAAAATKKHHHGHANHLFRKLKKQSKKVKHSEKSLHVKAHRFKFNPPSETARPTPFHAIPMTKAARAAAQAKMKRV